MFRQNNHDFTLRLPQQQVSAYLQRNPIAILRHAPFAMCIGDTVCGPDAQIILNDNPHYTSRGMRGPSDIVVEIVDHRTGRMDHGEKVCFYENIGVSEYWIIDIRHREVRLFQRDRTGIFIAQYPDYAKRYQTPLLPGFALYVPMLWDVASFSRQTAEVDIDPAPQKNQLYASRR